MSEAESIQPDPDMGDESGARRGSPDPAAPPSPAAEAVAVFVAFFVVFLLWPSVVYTALMAGGVYRGLYDQATLERAAQPGPEQTRLRLWATVVAFPFQLVSAPALLLLLTGTHPEQIGLTTRRVGRNALLGVVVCAGLAPLVLGLHWLVQTLYAHWPDVQTQEHQLQQLAERGLTPVEWALWLFAVLVAAPLLEEIFFRGVLQTWMARHHNAWAAVPLALLAAAGMDSQRWTRILETAAGGGLVFVDAVAPLLLVLVLLPPFVWLLRRYPRGDAAAVYGSSLVFALVHTQAWPSPVALFVLALGLGTLAARTRSLVGPIVLHSLFNGASCAVFFLGRG